MKRFFGVALAWVLYYLGDLVSKPMTWAWTGDTGAKLYPLYNWLMSKSSDVQHAVGGASPWQHADESAFD